MFRIKGWQRHASIAVEQWKLDCEFCADAEVALGGHTAFVVGDDFLHVGQAQAETFDVVAVAGRYAVELLKNLLQILFLDAAAVVADGDIQVL